MSFLKNSKFPTTLFMTTALITFLAVASFYFIFRFNFLFVNFSQKHNLETKRNNKYFYKERNVNDPYITLKPKLSRLINGPIISEDDPILGNKNAKVSLVIFSDFSCVYCQNEENILKNILHKYGDKINLIRKDYPLLDKKTESFRAARAARCAQEQGGFWPFHDLLFKNPEKRKEENFIEFAKKINLNDNIFKKCLLIKKVDEKINNNIKEADALDIYGIPFVYINDQIIVGEFSEEELEKIINSELEK